ncbi:hypothetical protein NDU88_002623 [Pleurodeles waltl]|uniref:Uncharacterized protein n=1 Tax=Pleurodeles waltl TaxID=8319 RepID=A0AAV7RAI2_PLEWA|nr:hypothetical protein NDU88_002623 [Pleurodeles waltl]
MGKRGERPVNGQGKDGASPSQPGRPAGEEILTRIAIPRGSHPSDALKAFFLAPRVLALTRIAGPRSLLSRVAELGFAWTRVAGPRSLLSRDADPGSASDPDRGSQETPSHVVDPGMAVIGRARFAGLRSLPTASRVSGPITRFTQVDQVAKDKGDNVTTSKNNYPFNLIGQTEGAKENLEIDIDSDHLEAFEKLKKEIFKAAEQDRQASLTSNDTEQPQENNSQGQDKTTNITQEPQGNTPPSDSQITLAVQQMESVIGEIAQEEDKIINTHNGMDDKGWQHPKSSKRKATGTIKSKLQTMPKKKQSPKTTNTAVKGKFSVLQNLSDEEEVQENTEIPETQESQRPAKSQEVNNTTLSPFLGSVKPWDTKESTAQRSTAGYAYKPDTKRADAQGKRCATSVEETATPTTSAQSLKDPEPTQRQLQEPQPRRPKLDLTANAKGERPPEGIEGRSPEDTGANQGKQPEGTGPAGPQVPRTRPRYGTNHSDRPGATTGDFRLSGTRPPRRNPRE